MVSEFPLVTTIYADAETVYVTQRETEFWTLTETLTELITTTEVSTLSLSWLRCEIMF